MSITFDKNIFFTNLEEEIIDSMSKICLSILKWKGSHPDTIVPNRFIYSKYHNYANNGLCRGMTELSKIIGSIINVVVLMKIKATTFIFLRTKKHDKFLIKY